MPKHIYLGLAIHSHQPVGNFDFVFAEAYQKAYEPLIAALERHPSIRMALHFSGCLRDWIVEHHPDYFPRIAALVARGQVEIMTGGYYEPILVAIPDVDKLGQIEKLTQAVRDDFGYEPTGLWLAERVWEPHLAKPLSEAGIEYTIVDDTHFKYVGLEDKDLFGYYVTEEQGAPLKIFGTSKWLRYSIPWKSVEEVMEYLRREAENVGAGLSPCPKIAVMGDDGEKFGLWPGTYTHCWAPEDGGPGWMEEFFTALEENSDWVTTIPPGEYARRFPALGRIYLPTASYDEMTEWALPADDSHDIVHLKERLKQEGRDDALRFVKGGFWRNFLAKYPEVNNLHKKMLWVSEKVHRALTPSPLRSSPPLPTLRLRSGQALGEGEGLLDHLWAGQCNCPYWHGVFGGIYLSHIRTANYRHLIEAERLADAALHSEGGWVTVEETDFDRDSLPEVLVESDAMNCYLAPYRGGQLFEWDWRAKNFNLLNGFTRRPEGYHRDLTEAAAQGRVVVSGSPEDEAGIHVHIVRVKEPGIEKELVYDWYRRVGLIDHFLHPGVTVEGFARAETGEAGDFVSEPFAWQIEQESDGSVTVRLYRDGGLWMGDEFRPVRLEKALRIAPRALELPVSYTILNKGHRPLETRFGVEFNFGLLSGHHPDGRYTVPGHELEDSYLDSMGEVIGAQAVELVHRYFGLRVRWEWDQPATLWRCPVNTISNSEAGFERVYQASCVLPLWDINLGPGESWQVSLRFTLQEI